MKRLIGIFVLMLGCHGPSSPTDVLDPVIYPEWKIAQERLTCLGVGVHGIEPESFKWQKHPGPFSCGALKDRNGCYSPSKKMISWNAQTPTVISHEAGHAILHVLGRPYWKCYEHGEGAKDWCPAKWAFPKEVGC